MLNRSDGTPGGGETRIPKRSAAWTLHSFAYFSVNISKNSCCLHSQHNIHAVKSGLIAGILRPEMPLMASSCQDDPIPSWPPRPTTQHFAGRDERAVARDNSTADRAEPSLGQRPRTRWGEKCV